MALDSTHPRYTEMLPDWIQARDFTKGERAVKTKREVYLPATKGMKLDGMNPGDIGYETYEAYLTRAVFPEYMKEAVEHYMGMLHNKSPVIELPPEMEFMRENCTDLGEPMELLLQRINLEQLATGRVGLLLDLPSDPDPAAPMPYIALYVTEAIRNWDYNETGKNKKLKLVVLDESGFRMNENFDWVAVTKYRVLRFEDVYTNGAFESAGGGTPQYDPSAVVTPQIRGKTLDEIPFMFINSKDISPDPDEAPLITLVRLCGAIYRAEADYRQNLFMQGQDTLVVIGARSKGINDPRAAEEPLRTGAGSRIDLDQDGDAKYIGVNGQGLPEQRMGLENDRKRAEARSGQLIDASKGEKESGAALMTRVGAQTATLNQIAKTGALALELLLKKCAVWMGADPEKVKVQPNLEFADYQMSGQDAVNLMTAKRDGAPISMESIHRLFVQGNLTRMDYPSEMDLIKKEPPLPVETKAPGSGGGGPAPKDPSNPAPNND